MSWIKLETHIFDKLEIFEIAEELNIDPDSVVGKCCRIWSWFDLNTTNGVTPSVTESLLDRYCGIKGFCNAMLKAGWMEKDDKNLYLPNFDRHNSQSAKDRALTAKRVSKHRKNKISNDESNADSNGKCNAISNAEPLHESLDREDKIREEYTHDFELFWKSYPRHEAKSSAMKAFKKVKVDINILLQAIAQQKNSKQWKDNIIPHASTWLNQSRWEDEIITKPTNDIFSPVRIA